MEQSIDKKFVVVLVVCGTQVFARSSTVPTDTTTSLEEAAKFSSLDIANQRRAHMTTNWVARAKIMELHTEMKPTHTLREV